MSGRKIKILGIFNTIIPIGTNVNGTEGTLAAISAGDYRAAGKTGIQTLLIAVATAITLGEGAAALAGGKGAGTAAIANAENAALKNAAKEGVTAESAALRPYGGPGGGHHVPAKRAFEGAAGYDAKRALAIPNAELKRLGVLHSTVTGAQMTGYRAFAQTGATLTWEAVTTIETNALIRGGMAPELAGATVHRAIQTLKNTGIAEPTRIPWGP